MLALSRRLIHELFEAGVFLKALNSVWETASGLFLLFAAKSTVERVLVYVSNLQLLGDRDDALFGYINDQLHQLSVSTHTFVGLYLLFHGIMNAFLAYNLYRSRLWAYPITIAFISLFFIYQMYRLSHTHSPLLLAVSIFDVIFIWLTWEEYRFQLKKQHASS